MIAGGLAHRGYLQLPWAIATVYCCPFSTDQFFFQVGKRSGKRLLAKRPKREPRVDKMRRFLVACPVVAVLGFRFICGMRTITPLFLGASNFDTRRFVLLNLCSTFVWASVVGVTGYFFGHLLATLFDNVRHHLVALVLVAAGISYIVWLWRRWAEGRF